MPLTKVQSQLLGTGAVLQVVQGVSASALAISSSSYVDVSLSATITPTSTTSKILVLTNISVASSNAGTGKYFRLVRGATAIGLGGSGNGGEAVSFGDYCPQHANSQASLAFNFLDTPATTGATTYKWTARSTGAVTFYVNRASGLGAGSYAEPLSTITLVEIAG